MEGITQAASSSPSDRVRLHITPFNKELADRYLGPSLRALATGLSFHSIQTDPGRGFGYVELPAMDAEKLQKKLNGMVLKGAKVKIETARPEKKRKQDAIDSTTDSVETPPKKIKKDKKDRKSKHGHNVILGHELEEGRHVKRGWEDKNEKSKSTSKTDSKEKTKSKKSSDRGIEHKEMRFKTVIPPNVTPIKSKSSAKTKSDDKETKSRHIKKTSVVKEFEHARRPAPGSSVTTGPRPAGYEDGKGWVDDSGAVVQAESSQTKRKRNVAVPEIKDVAPAPPPSRTNIQQDGEMDGDSDASAENLSDESSVVSSSSESESDGDDESEEQDGDSVTDATDPVVATPGVHPLEALFKRPALASTDSPSKSKPGPIDTSFSFFTEPENGDDTAAVDNEDDATPVPTLSLIPPQTPHTKMDMEWRTLRSGAPTPDTHAIGKRFNFDIDAEVDDDEEVEDEDITSHVADQTLDAMDLGHDDAPRSLDGEDPTTSADGAREESAFRKWFYQHRGDLNRSWKKRRREERKAQRQRENRRVSRKVA